MARANDYTVILNTKLDISQIQKDLAALQKQLESKKIDLSGLNNSVVINQTANAIANVVDNSEKAKKSTDDLSLSFQAANEIFSKTIDIISSMAQQVLELDTALTEFRKVSDLSGEALDNYVGKLTEMGSTVARTGKPKCLSRSVRMVNVH